MLRLITWLSRLHEIRRSVANLVRSHYDRRDIEALFELQPRAAQKLVEMLPRPHRHLAPDRAQCARRRDPWTSPSVPAGNFTPASRYTHPLRNARRMPT